MTIDFSYHAILVLIAKMALLSATNYGRGIETLTQCSAICGKMSELWKVIKIFLEHSMLHVCCTDCMLHGVPKL